MNEPLDFEYPCSQDTCIGTLDLLTEITVGMKPPGDVLTLAYECSACLHMDHWELAVPHFVCPQFVTMLRLFEVWLPDRMTEALEIEISTPSRLNEVQVMVRRSRIKVLEQMEHLGLLRIKNCQPVIVSLFPLGYVTTLFHA